MLMRSQKHEPVPIRQRLSLPEQLIGSLLVIVLLLLAIIFRTL